MSLCFPLAYTWTSNVSRGAAGAERDNNRKVISFICHMNRVCKPFEGDTKQLT